MASSEPGRLHAWNGRLHVLPVNFRFPNCSTLAWQYWVCGDASKEVPPLRFVTATDMPSRDARKRLCEFRFVMTQIEKACQEQDLWSDDMNIDYAMAAFFAVEYDILTNDSTTVS